MCRRRIWNSDLFGICLGVCGMGMYVEFAQADLECSFQPRLTQDEHNLVLSRMRLGLFELINEHKHGNS